MKIKTIKKLVPVLIWILVFSFSVTVVLATDNADSGNNASQSAVAGFYRSKDWMYKVSIYVGKSDTAKPSGSIKDFYLVGQPIFIAPTTLSIPANRNVYASPYNKMQYLSGQKLSVFLLGNQNIHNFSGVPAIPIINKGHINAVKQYFGDTTTLINLLDKIAKVQGTTKEAMLTSKTYVIQGVAKSLSAEKVLPIKNSMGAYQNLVPYLVVYEPIAIGYLTDGKTALAFTATEYAIAQKNGFQNFFTLPLGNPVKAPQLMWGLTHRDLPNSIFLEESWLGLPARAEVKNRKRTNEWTKPLIDSVSDTIIAGAGIGMRFLQANAELIKGPMESEDTTTYRTDTEVITSIKVSAPATGNRIDTFNPNSPAVVTFKINGMKKSHSLILPDGGSQYAWIKWRTPKQPGIVHIRIDCSNGLYIEDGSSGRDIYANVVSVNKNTPPDPQPHDTSKTYNYKGVSVPKESEVKENTWSEYFATWKENWVDRGEWENEYKKNPKTGKMELSGRTWKSNWIDEGFWDWELRTYYARLSTKITLLPSDETPTATISKGKHEIKSGYGVKIKAEATITTNAPSSDHYTNAGTAIAYFPEFGYKKYWRILQETGANVFGFQKNPYSQWEAPVHFTPLWYPDSLYPVYAEIQDVWTPAGMLKVNGSDAVVIKGNVYDDWHIGPTKPE